MAGSKLDIGPQALGACARCGTVAIRDTLVSWLVQLLTMNCLEGLLMFMMYCMHTICPPVRQAVLSHDTIVLTISTIGETFAQCCQRFFVGQRGGNFPYSPDMLVTPRRVLIFRQVNCLFLK